MGFINHLITGGPHIGNQLEMLEMLDIWRSDVTHQCWKIVKKNGDEKNHHCIGHSAIYRTYKGHVSHIRGGFQCWCNATWSETATATGSPASSSGHNASPMVLRKHLMAAEVLRDGLRAWGENLLDNPMHLKVILHNHLRICYVYIYIYTLYNIYIYII